jgi:hypothetical protein
VFLKKNLRMGLLCLVLGFGSIAGVTMCPDEIEELLQATSATKIVYVVKDEAEDDGD